MIATLLRGGLAPNDSTEAARDIVRRPAVGDVTGKEGFGIADLRRSFP